ncbi:helix-turn-helix domain-containing protein [bacterium]|nr:helix-turn-helix domain-containing protein [bacterium]
MSNRYLHSISAFWQCICMVALTFCHFELKAQKPLPEAYPRELKTIGDHLRKKRLDSKLFQKDVAKIIGSDECSIWNWENNYNKPVLNFIPKIIEFLSYIPYDVSFLSFGERLKIARQSLGMTG